MKDAGDKVPADISESVKSKVESVKSVKDGDDVEAIKKALAELGQELQKIGQHLYKDQQKPGEAGGANGAAGPEQSEGEEKK